MFLADWNICQQNTICQLPCGHPGCNWYFKTLAGRTKHRHASHSVITPSGLPRISSPSLPSSPDSVGPPFHPQNDQDQDARDWEDLNPLNENVMESGLEGFPTPFDSIESQFYGPGDRLYRNYHPKLTGNVTYFNMDFSSNVQNSAKPCNEHGEFLATGAPPTPVITNPNNWVPFDNHMQFETADLLYTRIQMSAPQINTLMDIWAATLLEYGARPPFDNCHSLYNTIDSIPLGDVK